MDSQQSFATTVDDSSAFFSDHHERPVQVVTVQPQQQQQRKSSDSAKLEWSLKSLRSEFKMKNTEIHFARYQKRLKHRLFTVLLIMNILICLIDISTYLIYKVGEILLLYSNFRAKIIESAIFVIIGLILYYHWSLVGIYRLVKLGSNWHTFIRSMLVAKSCQSNLLHTYQFFRANIPE